MCLGDEIEWEGSYPLVEHSMVRECWMVAHNNLVAHCLMMKKQSNPTGNVRNKIMVRDYVEVPNKWSVERRWKYLGKELMFSVKEFHTLSSEFTNGVVWDCCSLHGL